MVAPYFVKSGGGGLDSSMLLSTPQNRGNVFLINHVGDIPPPSRPPSRPLPLSFFQMVGPQTARALVVDGPAVGVHPRTQAADFLRLSVSEDQALRGEPFPEACVWCPRSLIPTPPFAFGVGEVSEWQDARAPPRIAQHRVRMSAHGEPDGEPCAPPGGGVGGLCDPTGGSTGRGYPFFTSSG